MDKLNFSVRKIDNQSRKNTVRTLAECAGVMLIDNKTGEVHNYRFNNVIYSEYIIPEKSPQWGKDLKETIREDRELGVQLLSDVIENMEFNESLKIYQELLFDLPKQLNDEKNMDLAVDFAQSSLARRDLPVLVNFHVEENKETGERKSYIRALITPPFKKKSLLFGIRQRLRNSLLTFVEKI